MIYLIPNGPVQLHTLFPSVDFGQVEEYYIQVQDDQGTTMATHVRMKPCKCGMDGVTVHFLNYLGVFDSVTFLRPTITHEDDGETYVKGLPVVGRVKTDAYLHRFNVRANDTYDVVVKCREVDMPWLQELADSPQHYMEWTGIEGQADSFLPLIKQAGKFAKVKNDGTDFQYLYTATFILANPVVTLRG